MGSSVSSLSLGGGGAHCAMLGLDASGKTTILYRIKFGHYVNTAPTIGFNNEKLRLKGCSSVLTVWDVGGQDKLRPLWRSYTRCADAIIFVVDACKEDRLEEAKLELQRIYKGPSPVAGGPSSKATAAHSASSATVPLLVLANKQDLPNALEPSKVETALGLKELGAVRWHLQPTCAITGEGLDEAMAALADMLTAKSKKKRTSMLVLPAAASHSSPATRSADHGASSGGGGNYFTKRLQRSNSHLF